MNTLLTDKKFTVMLSAYQATNTELQNLLDTEQLHGIILNELHAHPVRAVGVYKGSTEQSFVVHTNSSQVVNQLKRYAFDYYHQVCVLVSNNRKHDITLHNSNAMTNHIGERFVHHDHTPKGANSYTVLNGGDYWTVN